jgi:DNA-directed RNA polymerase subunit M/transcription elongation factor TFIIS
MVLVTSIQPAGSLQELSVPAKSADVLEWLRGKLKQPGLQFQGKIQDKDSWVTVFAESGCEDEDDNINQHVLGGNFQDEVFVGCIVVMLSKNSNADNYDKSAAAYTNLKPADYETIYAGWTFEGESSEEEEEEVAGEDDVSENEHEAEEEDAPAEAEEEALPRQRKPKQVVIHDVNTPCPLRDLVKKRYTEIGIPADIADSLEAALLQRCIRDCAKQGIEVTWANVAFWNHYRGRCIQFYENAPEWISKLVSGEVSAAAFAEMTVVELNPKRWKAQIEAQIEKDKHLYSHSGNASIFFYCSQCKKKSKCDYYQMQTRSADEPMTTFVTCLECDRRWKF